MKTDKWLYFRQVTDTDNDDGTDSSESNVTSIMIPANKLVTMYPSDDTTLLLSFRPIKMVDNNGAMRRTHAPNVDNIALTVGTNKHKEVIDAISQAITNPASSNPFIVVADDVLTFEDNSTRTIGEYISTNVSACTAINIYKVPQGTGIHEYFENVSVVGGTTDSSNDVVGSLQVKLPNQVVLLEAAIYPVNLATNDVGSVALEYHTAAIADDAASEGTEIVGADTINLSIQGVTNAAGTKDVDNTSVPDADLDISSNATAGKGIHSGVMDPIAMGAADTYFHVCAKEDMATITGTPQVGVYIKWFGKAAVPLS